MSRQTNASEHRTSACVKNGIKRRFPQEIVWYRITLTWYGERRAKSGRFEYLECSAESVGVHERWLDGGKNVDEGQIVPLCLVPDDRVVKVREVFHGEDAVQLGRLTTVKNMDDTDCVHHRPLTCSTITHSIQNASRFRKQFPLVLIELFTSCYGWGVMSGYWSKSLCSKGRGWVTLSANFRGKEGRPPTTVDVRKLKSLGYHVALFV